MEKIFLQVVRQYAKPLHPSTAATATVVGQATAGDVAQPHLLGAGGGNANHGLLFHAPTGGHSSGESSRTSPSCSVEEARAAGEEAEGAFGHSAGN